MLRAAAEPLRQEVAMPVLNPLGRTLIPLLITASLAGAGQASSPAVVNEWSARASEATAAAGMHPLRAPITLALVHLAMYDAVNAVAGGHAPYAAAPSVVRPASAEAAAVEAAYRVLLAEAPSQAASLEAARTASLAAIPEPARANGAAVGAAAAQALLASRAQDGRDTVVPHAPGNGPGAWIPTPPGSLAAVAPFLGRVTPFTMQSPSQFRPAGPPRLDSPRYAAEYREVRALGAKTGSTRTPGQTATALFWEPLAGTVWPASIRRMAAERGLDIATAARFEAAAFAAFADGLIACWDAKYHFGFWRPVTAIRAGDADGNAATEPDPAWEPLSTTPAFPEYPSGHACTTTAVANVMEDFFPQDLVIPARNVVTGEERVYTRARDVSDEVVEARMLLGVHFRAGDEDGAEIGRRIARRIRTELFRPRSTQD
jgi:hypothetical protein